MLLIQYPVRSHPSLREITSEDLPAVLQKTRDFYAHLGMTLVMRVQQNLSVPKDYATDPQEALDLFQAVDEIMETKLKEEV